MTIMVLPYLRALFIRIELKSKCNLNNSIEGNYPLIEEHVVLFKVVSINKTDGLAFPEREVFQITYFKK